MENTPSQPRVDESFPTQHSITSSACKITVCGIVSASAWAVFRLMMSSSFVVF